jgi:hypothetical protein
VDSNAMNFAKDKGRVGWRALILRQLAAANLD